MKKTVYLFLTAAILTAGVLFFLPEKEKTSDDAFAVEENKEKKHNNDL